MRFGDYLYRDEIYSLQILLSTTKAGPGRTVKKEQEEISPNHVQRLNLISVLCPPYLNKINPETQNSAERLPKYRGFHGTLWEVICHATSQLLNTFPTKN